MTLPAIPEETAWPREVDIKENVAHYVGVMRRRWVVVLAVFLTAVAAGFALAASRGPRYQTSAMLLVPADVNSTSSIISGDPIAAMLSNTLPSGLESQLKLLQSDSFIAEAKRRAGIRSGGRRVAPAVTVEGQRDANTIQITVEGGDPQQIAKLANAMVDLHLERMELSSSTGFREAIQFARKENEEVRKNLAEAERVLFLFRQAHPAVALSSHEAQAGEFAALAARVPETENNIAITKAQIGTLEARVAREPRVLNQRKENPRFIRLQSKLDDLKFQRMDLLREFRPTSRQVRDLDQQIAELRRALNTEPQEIEVPGHFPNPTRELLETRLEELRATLRGLERSRNAALAQVQAQKTLIDQVGPWEIQLERLIRNRDTAQTAYTAASDRLRDLETRSRAWKQMSGMPQAVVRASVPDRPSQPLKPKHIAMLGLIALLLAAGAALLQEFLDDRMTSPQNADRVLRLPILGHIPPVVGGTHPVISTLPTDSSLVESYRSLRANIGFAAMDAPLRSMIVTSARDGEGKSTVAVNLAIALAMSGRSVILVDADLRHSRSHKTLGLPPGPGLAEVLLGKAAVDCVLSDPNIAGLRVLTSGSASANPADLLSMGTMTALIDALRGMADIVVIDTPSCLQVTDAQILAAQVDGVLMIADLPDMRKTDVMRMRARMDRAYARTVGLIFNRSSDQAKPLGPIRMNSPLGEGVAGPKPLPARSPTPPEAAANRAALKPGHSLTYLALFLFSVVLWFRPYELIPALSSFTSLAFWLGLLTLIIFVPSQLALEGTLTARPREVKLVLLLCLAALVSMPFAISPGEAWTAFTDTFVKAIVIFIVMVNAVRTESRLRGLLLVELVAGCVVGFSALNDYWHGRFTVEGYRVQGDIGGMFGNPNDMSLHLVTMIPIAIGLSLGSRAPISRFGYGACAALSTAAIAVSYSRGGFIGLVAVLIVLVWKFGHRNPARVAALTLVGAAAFVLLAPHDYSTRLASILNPGLDPNGSATQRRDLLFRSIAVALRNPLFGVGMDNFHIVGIREAVSHNAFTQVGAELGLPALICYTGLILVPLARLRHLERATSRMPQHSRIHYLAIALQASLVGYIVSSLFASVAYLWYVYYLVGSAVCLCRLHGATSAAVLDRARARTKRTPTRRLRGRIAQPFSTDLA